MTSISAQKCPICGKKTVAEYRPFCSARCKDVDLGRWFTGAYAVPAQLTTEEDYSALEQELEKTTSNESEY